jgi:hypothetical protein
MKYVGSEVLAAVVMNVATFWDTAPYSLFLKRRFGGTFHLHLQSHVAHWFLSRLTFVPEDEGDKFLRNVSSHTNR